MQGGDLAKHPGQGELTVDELRWATREAIALGLGAGVNRFLIDARATRIAPSLSALYDLPADRYVREGADRLSRIALVLPHDPRAREAALFYETACVNRGWQGRLFDEPASARAWLQGSAEPA